MTLKAKVAVDDDVYWSLTLSKEETIPFLARIELHIRSDLLTILGSFVLLSFIINQEQSSCNGELRSDDLTKQRFDCVPL